MNGKMLGLAVWAVGLLACGNGGTFSGKVAGNELSVKDAVFTVTRSQGKIVTSTLILADIPDVCTLLKANRNPKSATAFGTAFIRTNANGDVLATDIGNYTVLADLNGATAGNNVALAAFGRVDANCTNTLSAAQSNGKSGIIKVTEYNPAADGKMSGTFDITFGDQNDKVTGSFSADFCDVPAFATASSCE